MKISSKSVQTVGLALCLASLTASSAMAEAPERSAVSFVYQPTALASLLDLNADTVLWDSQGGEADPRNCDAPIACTNEQSQPVNISNEGLILPWSHRSDTWLIGKGLSGTNFLAEAGYP